METYLKVLEKSLIFHQNCGHSAHMDSNHFEFRNDSIDTVNNAVLSQFRQNYSFGILLVFCLRFHTEVSVLLIFAFVLKLFCFILFCCRYGIFCDFVLFLYCTESGCFYFLRNTYTAVYVSVGTLAVSISFPLIFLRCFACSDEASMWGHLMYYSPFIAVFQFGWASTQISHMALMSQLTQDRSQQTELNGLRSVLHTAL